MPDGQRLTVLFIAIEFPPMNSAGVFRALKLTKYLPEFGVTPVVLTLPASEGVHEFHTPFDEGLLAEIPGSAAVYRVSRENGDRLYSNRLRRFLTIYFSVEDSIAARWRASLREELPKIVARHQPDVLLVTMPPFSAGRLALDIAREYGLPLVVDMRDGWSHWTVGPFGSWVHFALTRLRERRIFAGASRVVTVTTQLANVFRRTHPMLPPETFDVIPNGHDGALRLPAVIRAPALRGGGTYTIGYIGSFYYTPEGRAAHFTPWWRRRWHRKLQFAPVREDWLYRSPYFLMRAMADLFLRHPELRGRLRFCVVGANAAWLTEMASALGVADACEFVGRVPQSELAGFKAQADAFLCTAAKVIGGEDYAIASKTFDYLDVGKPILGLVPEGAQREFLRRSGLGVLADPDDREASCDALERLVLQGVELTPDAGYLAGFHRRVIAERMSAVLRAAAEGGRMDRTHETEPLDATALAK